MGKSRKKSKKKRCLEGVGCSFIKSGSQLRGVINPPEPLERCPSEDIKWGDGGLSLAFRCKLCGDIIYVAKGP